MDNDQHPTPDAQRARGTPPGGHASGTLRTVACPDCQHRHALLTPPGDEHPLALQCSHCPTIWREGGPGQPRAPEGLRCAEHPGRPARTACEPCGRAFCGACTHTETGRDTVSQLCPDCGRGCLPLARGREVVPVWSDLPALLAYPVARKGLPILVFSVVLSSIPVVAWVFSLCLAAYLAHVLRTSARGVRHLPDFPDLVDLWIDVLAPLARILWAALVAAAPYLAYTTYWPAATPSDGAARFLLGLGVAIFPLLLVVVSVTRSFAAVVRLPTLARTLGAIRGDYVLTLLLLVPVVALRITVSGTIDDDMESLVVFGLLRAAELYTLFLFFHVLGRLVDQTRDRVEWGV